MTNELEQLLNDLKELGKDNGILCDEACQRFLGVKKCGKCPYPGFDCTETVAAVTAERLEKIMQNDPVKEAVEICEQITPPEQEPKVIKPRRVKIGDVLAFPNVKPDKAQALKVLEEAAEVFGAWQEWEKYKDYPSEHIYEESDLMDEIADVIQACVNLISAYGITDFNLPMVNCEFRNRERGRYGNN